MQNKNENGIALVAVLMVMVLLGILMSSFIVLVNSDQKVISTDRQQNQAFYGAMAGLEQLTAAIGSLYASTYRPSATQINELDDSVPDIEGIDFVTPAGDSGYSLTFETNQDGTPRKEQRTISSGNLAGLTGIVTPINISVTARSSESAEIQLERRLLAALVPVFQFGIFSESELGYFAGADFSFGGRVHTNSNLFLTQQFSSSLKLSEKVTAAGQVVRDFLSNHYDLNSNGHVYIAKRTITEPYCSSHMSECWYEMPESGSPSTTAYGSILGDIPTNGTTPTSNPAWANISNTLTAGYIKSKSTGAKTLNLPLVSDGATPIDIIRRPPINESSDSSVYAQRYFAKASLRILLSDTAEKITSLPTVTGDAPISLGTAWPGAFTHKVALSPGSTYNATTNPYGSSDYKTAKNTPLIDGYIKIEKRTSSGWVDVTSTILNLGISGIDLVPSSGTTPRCGYAHASITGSILRVQRYRDGLTATSQCVNTDPYRFMPNVLFDTREGMYRGTTSPPTDPSLIGSMYYIELDIQNLCAWLTAQGSAIPHEEGYVIYFSDRRLNRNASGDETAEFGYEDVINTDAAGTPNGTLNTGEDVNDNNALDTYGGTKIYADLGASVTLSSTFAKNIIRKNRPVFFRRALKLINGSVINLGTNGTTPYGLTIAAENPVYVQGNYNANGTFSGSHVAAAVIADAVTLLSNSWKDSESFDWPYLAQSGTTKHRASSTTWYRMAVIAGKNKSFPNSAGTFRYDFGTDGGVNNFLRMIENWDATTLNYLGSMVSLYYSRQAVGVFKYNDASNIWNFFRVPTRAFAFDVDFLTPEKLPPASPMFRDINVTTFTRKIMPE
jgi:hypothetical protein